MNPHFAAAVDSVVLRVLHLMDQVERNNVESPEWEKQSLENLIAECDSKLNDSSGWPLAKYALAAWIDDLLIAPLWSGRDWWESNSLEFTLFKSRDRATKFFIKAKEAAELTRRDALEVFYLCAVMGFRGLYSLPEASIIADQLNLPMSLSTWADNTAGSLQLRQGRPPIQESPQPASGAPPLEGRYDVVGSLVVTVLLSILLATLVFISNSVASIAT